ncbi:MAG: hypothetical protein IMZ61_03810, partial [Planctomycetes bacterium]|nr:hypothetical protein [Planctomycetota bacterium]
MVYLSAATARPLTGSVLTSTSAGAILIGSPPISKVTLARDRFVRADCPAVIA